METSLPPTASAEDRGIWKTEFPLNVRTALFCFFVGSVWSVPVGLLRNEFWDSYAPPEWTADIYFAVLAVSVVGVPFITMSLRDVPLLHRMGRVLTLILVAVIVAGYLFPALEF